MTTPTVYFNKLPYDTVYINTGMDIVVLKIKIARMVCNSPRIHSAALKLEIPRLEISI